MDADDSKIGIKAKTFRSAQYIVQVELLVSVGEASIASSRQSWLTVTFPKVK